jgi:hypothetical protein
MSETDNSFRRASRQTRRIPISLRTIRSPTTLRVSVFKPVLNIARFFIGDTIPRVSSPEELYAEIKSHKERGIEVTQADTMLLTKLIALLMKAAKDPDKEELFDALRLLSGLVLYVIEDDYFFIPEVTEYASHEKLEWLALKLAKAHKVRTKKIDGTIKALHLKLSCAVELSAIEASLPPYMQNKELSKVISKVKVHLDQGEAIFAKHSDGKRKARHQSRLNLAYFHTANLLARLLVIPKSADNPRLRKRIISRGLRIIELDSLGAQYISEAEQHDQAEKLLAKAETNFGDKVTKTNKSELLTRLSEIAQQQASEAEQDSQEEAGWFFDMD